MPSNDLAISHAVIVRYDKGGRGLCAESLTGRWSPRRFTPVVIARFFGESEFSAGEQIANMKVAYVFSTSGHTASYKLGKMILPQLEQGSHGVEVVGLFFFDDNNYILRKGDPIGERLAKVAAEQGILLMMCDQCAVERGLAEGEPGTFPSPVKPVGTVDGVQVGCFPDLYTALSGNMPDQVITL